VTYKNTHTQKHIQLFVFKRLSKFNPIHRISFPSMAEGVKPGRLIELRELSEFACLVVQLV